MKYLKICTQVLLLLVFLGIVCKFFYRHLKYPYRTSEAIRRLEDVEHFLKMRDIKNFRLSYYDFDGTFSLYVFDRDVRDLNLISDIPLSELRIDYTHISDLAPLEKQAKSLLRLSANVTWIQDLSPLRYCTNLQSLSISDTFVDTLAPISNVPLYELDIRGTSIDDLNPLNTNRLRSIRFSLDRHLDGKGVSRIRSNPNINIGPRVPAKCSWTWFDEFYSAPTNNRANEIRASWEIHSRAKYFDSFSGYR